MRIKTPYDKFFSGLPAEMRPKGFIEIEELRPIDYKDVEWYKKVNKTVRDWAELSYDELSDVIAAFENMLYIIPENEVYHRFSYSEVLSNKEIRWEQIKITKHQVINSILFVLFCRRKIKNEISIYSN